MSTFKNHDVQSVNIQTTAEKAFNYIANPSNLPEWTGAFRQADEKSALLITPNGELKIGFDKIRCITEDHITPFNTTQNFLFCSFKRQKE